MVETDTTKGGKSQEMVKAESRRCCVWTRTRLAFLFLLAIAVIVFYITDLSAERAPSLDWPLKWLEKYGIGSTGSGTSVVPPNTTGVSLDTGPCYVEYPHKYHFILDEPEKCGEENPFLVLMVPVAPYNREARDAIRSTWGTERQVLGKEVRLFFLLGLPSGEGADQLQVKVSEESRDHRDLLQSDFIDCYKNLTIKTMMMMEWLSSRCPNASYAMKIDSDMFLNVNTLVNMLLHAREQRFMTGLVARWGAVLRDPNSKWYIPKSVLADNVYPPYTLGLGYVFSLDLPRKLVEASRHVKAVYIEDVYLGLCMRHLGIEPTDPPAGNLFNVFPVPYNRCAYSRLIATTTHSLTDQVNAWRDLHRPGPPC
ncbi:hypothetical protein DPEC_G00249680 [Dallia pectoralis]|uniref:Uncharacterized protein n=1 Tax=Dallia pectoralis TaxID=75939 RepID=A0ACC2FST5_DALPE|nr:hypothetical protein DPEC_G00249680 [Dallia pectoralis]